MDNVENATEKDYAPQIEIPDETHDDQKENSQVETEDQGQEERVDQEGEEDSGRTSYVDPDLEKKWREQKKRLSKMQREKHRIAAEAEQLRFENENLKKFNQTSNQVGQAHYENSLKLKLEQAKENKRKARELNDIDSELVADEELASAVTDLRAIDSWKAQQMIQQQEVEHNQQRQQQHNQYEPRRDSYDDNEYETNEQTERWLKQNQWFDEKSQHYDPDKADEVLTYAQALDANLAKQGREDEYLTKAYFDRINNYARIYDQQRNDSRQERISNIPNVAPVRRTTLSNQKPAGMQLSDDEKFMARNAGISEDDWKKAKVEDMKRQKEKMKYNNPVY